MGVWVQQCSENACASPCAPVDSKRLCVCVCVCVWVFVLLCGLVVYVCVRVCVYVSLCLKVCVCYFIWTCAHVQLDTHTPCSPCWELKCQMMSYHRHWTGKRSV